MEGHGRAARSSWHGDELEPYNSIGMEALRRERTDECEGLGLGGNHVIYNTEILSTKR